MRTSTIVLALAAVGLAGCSTSTGTATPVGNPSSAPAASAAPTTYHLGQAIELKTDQSDITVTLVAVKQTAAPTDPTVDTPAAGNRYAAAEFRITNDSATAFQDAPDNSAKAIGSDGTQFDTTIIGSGLVGGTLMPSQVNLVSHASGLGWVVFEVAKAAKVTGIQYTSDSGFGSTALWTLG